MWWYSLTKKTPTIFPEEFTGLYLIPFDVEAGREDGVELNVREVRPMFPIEERVVRLMRRRMGPRGREFMVGARRNPTGLYQNHIVLGDTRALPIRFWMIGPGGMCVEVMALCPELPLRCGE